MMTFLIGSGLMVLLLLLIVMIPLLRKPKKVKTSTVQSNLEIYRDQFKELEDELARGAITQQEYDESRNDLERRVLEDTAPQEVEQYNNPKVGVYTTIMLFLVVPLFSAFVWIVTQPLGDYRLDGGKYEGVVDYNNGGGRTEGQEMHDMESAINKLRQHLMQNPGDLEGWMMLGRTMLTTRHYSEAADAFEKANRLAPGNPMILVDLADAIAMVQGQDLSGRPWDLVKRALQIDPTNWKALAMAGTDKFNHKDFRGAIMYWERLLKILPPGDGMQQSVKASIQEARDLGGIVGPVPDTLDFGAPEKKETPAALPSMVKEGLQPMGQSSVPQKPAEPAAAEKVTHTISGTVDIDPSLHDKMGDKNILYITARPANGGRMPIVQQKISVLDFPVHFKLDNTMHPPIDMGAGTLDQHKEVVITARLGSANRPMPQNGDLSGEVPQPVKVDSDDVKVVLDKVLQR